MILDFLCICSSQLSLCVLFAHMWNGIKVFVGADVSPRWRIIENEHFWWENYSPLVVSCYHKMLRKCHSLNRESQEALGDDAFRYRMFSGISWPVSDPLPEPPRVCVDSKWGPLCTIVVARNHPY